MEEIISPQNQLSLSSQILSVNFNQSYTFFTVGTDRGFALYKVDPLQKICERDMGGGIGIAVQLFETNFIGLVGGGRNPRFPTCKFVLWDDYKAPAGDTVVEEVVKDRILNVRLNSKVVAIVTRRHSYLYSLQNMQKICDIKTEDNPDGVCALSSARGNIFLCPGVEIGTVRIYDYVQKVEKIVKCHEHPIKFIALNTTFTLEDSRSDPHSDSMFATASVQGTLIKIFDVEKQSKVKELRRGGDASEIYSVSFSRDSKCLVATSKKCTVHVYSLTKDYENVSSRAGFLGGSYFGSEWSPFAINFTNQSQTANIKPGGKDFQTRNNEVYFHNACLVPIGLASKNDNTNAAVLNSSDTYRLLITSEDGTYAVHDLQFKDTKSIAKVSGLLQDLRVETQKK